MTITERLAAARVKAGQATKDAREFGASIREKQDKNEAVAEIEVKFNAAVKDARDGMVEINRLEAEVEMEAQSAALLKPRESFTGRVTNATPRSGDFHPNTPGINRQQRRERQTLARQREMFARAGVTEKNFDQFRFEVHPDAFLAFVQEGNGGAMKVLEAAGLKPMEAMALLSTNQELGGFLVHDEMKAEILKDLAGVAVMRRICRVERTGKNALVFPTIQSASTDADIYTSGYTGAWRAEGYVTGGTAPTVQNQPTFGQNRIPVYAWAPNAIELTQELLSDSEADLEGIVAEVIAETLGLDEDAAFLNGTGIERPIGILNAVSGMSLTEVNSGHATDVTYAGFIDVFANVPSQYRNNGRWLMNSLCLGAAMKIADGNGMPLFPINAVPGTLFGKPIEFSEFMPDRGTASNNPVIFGDFRYYGIADRQELRIQRLTERYAPNLGILPTARVGGQPLRTAAFRKMKMSA